MQIKDLPKKDYQALKRAFEQVTTGVVPFDTWDDHPIEEMIASFEPLLLKDNKYNLLVTLLNEMRPQYE